MQNLIEKLARARQIEMQYDDELEALESAIEALIKERYDSELRRVRLLRETAKADVADVEGAIRAAALDAFSATGDKRPHPAVGIREMTRLEYDEGEAIFFCRRAAPNALKLDRRAFEKIAKLGIEAGGPFDLDFVTIRKEPQAAIARDLSAYMGDKENKGE